MDAIDIKNQLRVRFRELQAFADQIKVSPQLLSMVINGARRNPGIRQAIAQALDLPVAEVFPEPKPDTNPPIILTRSEAEEWLRQNPDL